MTDLLCCQARIDLDILCFSVCVIVKLLLKVFGKISVSVFNFPPEISLVKSLKVLVVG